MSGVTELGRFVFAPLRISEKHKLDSWCTKSLPWFPDLLVLQVSKYQVVWLGFFFAIKSLC